MTNPDSTTQATLKKVRELADESKGSLRLLHSRLMTEREAEKLKYFPSIASLVESQAKRIEELEKQLQACDEKDESQAIAEVMFPPSLS